MLLGVGVLAVVAYYFWEKSAKDKANDAKKSNFVNPFRKRQDGKIDYSNGTMVSNFVNPFRKRQDGKIDYSNGTMVSNYVGNY